MYIRIAETGRYALLNPFRLLALERKLGHWESKGTL